MFSYKRNLLQKLNGFEEYYPSSQRPRQALEGLREISLAVRSIPVTYYLTGSLYGANCLSLDFTGSVKCVLGKQNYWINLVLHYAWVVHECTAISWNNKVD